MGMTQLNITKTNQNDFHGESLEASSYPMTS